MRILFFTHYFPPEGNAPASRTYEHCKRWVGAGHKVTVVTCAPNVPGGVVYPGYRNRIYQRDTIDGIDVVRIWTYIAANSGKLRRILNYLTYMLSATLAGLFVEKPDIVLATSPQLFCGWAGIFASRLRRAPLILEIRDIWPESIVAVGAIKCRSLLRFLEWLEIKMYDCAKLIVTVGDGYMQELVKKGVSSDKISVVTNGIDTQTLTPREPDVRLKNQLGLEGKFICSYVGTVGMACGLDIVIRAARALGEKDRKDIAFLIVGDGATLEDMKAQARRLGLGNIVFVGRQDKELIPNYLSISDVCLVHLRKAELFKTVIPSKIFEAAGMAVPIIIGVAGTAAELVLDADAGVTIEPENDSQLVKAIEEFVDNPDLGISYGLSGRRYVVKNYDRDNLATDYLYLVRMVLQKSIYLPSIDAVQTGGERRERA
jgi:glycosyltransferase involved in cell wall biosynthesis